MKKDLLDWTVNGLILFGLVLTLMVGDYMLADYMVVDIHQHIIQGWL